MNKSTEMVIEVTERTHTHRLNLVNRREWNLFPLQMPGIMLMEVLAKSKNYDKNDIEGKNVDCD